MTAVIRWPGSCVVAVSCCLALMAPKLGQAGESDETEISPYVKERHRRRETSGRRAHRSRKATSPGIAGTDMEMSPALLKTWACITQ